MLSDLTAGPVHAVAVTEAYSVIGSGSVMRVLDVSVAAAPKVIGELALPNTISDILITNGLVLAAANAAGLRVIDLASPSNPVEIGFLDDRCWALSVAVSGTYAFVGCSSNELRIIDISTPWQPHEVGAVVTPGGPRRVAAMGNIVFVLAGSSLQIIDASTPSAPFEIGTYTDSYVYDFAGKGNLLYVAARRFGLRILDVTTPSEPVEVGFYDTPGHPMGIAVSGEFAYLTIRNAGIHIIDVSTPLAPRGICQMDTPGFVSSVAISAGRAFVALGDAGLGVFQTPNHIYWLENAAHLPGLFGSQWRTDVVARNKGSFDASIEIRLHSPDDVRQLATSISPGGQGIFEDVVGLLGFNGKGSLEVRSSEPLQISGRTYNRLDEGTFGQYVEAHRLGDGLLAGEVASFLQLRQQEGEFRTNFSITNISTELATIRIRLFHESGELLKEYPLQVERESLLHDPEPFKRRADRPNLGWGFAEIEVVSGTGILASASVVDSRTNDATTVPLKR